MPSRLLYLGCQPGQDVMDLQDGLNAVTALPAQATATALLAVDGVFGSKTAARVCDFQQRNGLAADGIVGPQTWGVLVALLLSVPGLQVNRPVGGSGPGPAKGTDGSPVHGKDPKGYSGGHSGGGGKQAPSGHSGGGKQSQSGASNTGGKGGGGHDGGGSKQAPSGQSAGGGSTVWSPAFSGYYKSSTGGGSGKASGGSSSGGGAKGG